MRALPLEEILVAYGDMLYRMALVLTGQSSQATRLLRTAVRRVRRKATGTLDLSEFLGMLLQTRQQQAQRQHWHIRIPRLRPAMFRQHTGSWSAEAELYHAILALPLQQKQLLALALLWGYDSEQSGRVCGMSREQAHEMLNAGLAALAPAAAVPLPAAAPTDLCLPVRRAVTDAPEQLWHNEEIRGHLALCRACRAYEHAWNQLVQRIDAAIHSQLREQRMPPELRATLSRDTGHIASVLHRPVLRGLLVPLLVLGIAASLVVPGFFRPDTPRAAPPAVAETNPRRLVQQALETMEHLPSGTGVWHAQWDILWYFSNGSFAPLRANAWVDGQNPARYRLQLAHVDGGAPYELQITDGIEHVWYALNPIYYGSLYGDGQDRALPHLAYRPMQTDMLRQAYAARRRSGAWDVGPSYLRQARTATDLRLLGAQHDGNHTVQLVTFAGFSPLGFPPDAPETSNSRVTVLLAIDPSSGQLRRATELLGPTGSEQASRVTWRLRSDEWLQADDQTHAVFDIERAWNGKGRFPSTLQAPSAGASPLLVGQHELEHPLSLIDLPSHDPARALRFPASAPPGATYALLRLDPPGLAYYGPGRWLVIRPGTQIDRLTSSGEQLQAGDWSAQLDPGKSQQYQLTLEWNGGGGQATSRSHTAGADLVIMAHGYTRAELLRIAEDLQLPTRRSLHDQAHLFLLPDGADS